MCAALSTEDAAATRDRQRKIQLFRAAAQRSVQAALQLLTPNPDC
jgi:hypothetical protein